MNERGKLVTLIMIVFFSFMVVGCSDSSSGDEDRNDSAEVYSPWEIGPYPVGARTIVLVDHSRIDKIVGGPRTLVTEVWYPAVDTAAETPRSTLKDYFGDEFQDAIQQLLQEYHIEVSFSVVDEELLSHRNVPIRDGKFPVVIFSHGNGGVRFQSVYLTEFLASHGYIVLAPDHTANAAITIIDGQIILYDKDSFFYGMVDRVQDIEFMIDYLFSIDKAGSFLSGHMDLDHIGVAGHSFGSLTSISAASRDPRIKAIIPQAAPGFISDRFDVPALFMVGGKDQTVGVLANDIEKWEFNMDDGPAYFLNFVNAGHFTFSNMCDLAPNFGDGCGVDEKNGEVITYIDHTYAYKLIDYYAVSFLGYYLKGEKGYLKYLFENPDPNEIEFETNVVGAP